jgi:hypothetical protein
MYSMNRRIAPRWRAQRAIGRTLPSLIPRRTTMFTLIGASPASNAASMPSSTFATGNSIPFIAPKTASSSESRLTVTRRSPPSASGRASARRAEPLVVRVKSTSPPSGRRMAASIAIRSGRFRLTSGSPPVIRSLATPSETKIRAARSISSNDRTWSRGRKA